MMLYLSSASLIIASINNNPLHLKVMIVKRITVKMEGGGSMTRLSKFKFSANFLMCLHVILQKQIKYSKMLISYVKKIF